MTHVFGVSFRSPVLLAAGTAGFGEVVSDVMDLSKIGGLVSKSITYEPRGGNPAPRVTEYHQGMMNSVGLANPGLDAVKQEKLPWMRENLDIPVFLSVAGHTPEEYEAIVSGLAAEEGFCGFELNLSCPNDTRTGGRAFSLDPEALTDVVTRLRPLSDLPMIVKLAPNDPDIAATAQVAVAAGADGITAINTVPGLLLDPGTGAPGLGAGPGGVSGPGIRPVGLGAVKRIAEAVDVPVIGVGGILTPDNGMAYLGAGASLVQVGTGSFADPRCAERVGSGMLRRLSPTS